MNKEGRAVRDTCAVGSKFIFVGLADGFLKDNIIYLWTSRELTSYCGTLSEVFELYVLHRMEP